MRCDICGQSINHNPRCPYHSPKKSKHYCFSCGEEILAGEEYVENIDGECRHYECFHGMRELLEWIGFDIKIMEDISND